MWNEKFQRLNEYFPFLFGTCVVIASESIYTFTQMLINKYLLCEDAVWFFVTLVAHIQSTAGSGWSDACSSLWSGCGWCSSRCGWRNGCCGRWCCISACCWGSACSCWSLTWGCCNILAAIFIFIDSFQFILQSCHTIRKKDTLHFKQAIWLNVFDNIVTTYVTMHNSRLSGSEPFSTCVFKSWSALKINGKSFFC